MAEPYGSFLFFLFLSLVVAIGAFYLGFASFKKARLVEDTPTSVIRSAPQGYVELRGQSKPDQKKQKAPLTGQPCLWYEYKIEKYVRSNKSSSWRTLKSGSSDLSFYIFDETGECHVHPEGAHVVANVSQVWYGNSEVPDTAPGVANSVFSAKPYRYTERRIHEGEMLYALGLFRSITPPSASEEAKDYMSELLRTWKMDRYSLLQRFDKNRDGEIDAAEWQLARKEAADQAKAYILEHYDGSQIHILGAPEDRFYKFIISTKSPLKLIKGFRKKGWMYLCGFLFFLGVFAYFLQQYLSGAS